MTNYRFVEHIETKQPILVCICKTQKDAIAKAKNKTGTRKIIKNNGSILTFSDKNETTISRPTKLPYFNMYFISIRMAKTLGLNVSVSDKLSV